MSKRRAAKASDTKAATRTAPPAPASHPRRLAEIPLLRYAPYVAAAAVLHGAVWYLQQTGRLRMPGLPGKIWIPHVCLLVGMVLVRLFANYGRSVAMAVAVCTTTMLVRPAWGAALLAFLLVTWAIARLPLPALARVALVLAVNFVFPALRAGLFGAEAAALFRPGVASVLWSVLLLRSLLYQVEVTRLLPEERGLLEYVGSFAVIPLAGGAALQPITYRRFIGEYGAADAEQTLRAGIGLLALGALYLWLRPALVAEHSSTLLMAMGRAARVGGLAAALVDHGRAEVGVALGLVQLERYLMIAGSTFYVIGSLRLLGFNLASGYRYPFISRNFLDMWQRTNFYIRECQLVLYYVPLAKLLRHRLSPRATAAIATTGAILGHVVLAILVSHLILVGWSDRVPLERMLLDAGRFGVIGLLTIASVVRRRIGEPELRVSWPRRIWQTVFVIGIAAVNLAVWELLMQGFSWTQTVAVLRFVVLGQLP